MAEGTESATSDDHELLNAMEELERAQQRVAQLRQQSREKAIADVKEKIKMYDLTPEELGFSKVMRQPQASSKSIGQRAPSSPPSPGTALSIDTAAVDGRSQVKPKYRSLDGKDTWSGRGKPPLWMRPHLEAGGTKEDFLVDKSDT